MLLNECAQAMASYNVCVLFCKHGSLGDTQHGVRLEGARIVMGTANILESLHVLLVTEDEVRGASLAKALRERKASVGDFKAGSRDPLALRGADLLVVDSRSAETTKNRVAEMRSDVRARWASLVQLNFAKLVLDDGSVALGELEALVGPHVAADKALTERAKNEESFEIGLRPLGPTRMLRALAASGPTLHVELFHETLSGVVDLSNELLVCAFAERGTSEKWEAWTALVRILGLLDAKVKVSRRSHPTAMNIMEPIDQALEVAAQERQSSAALIAVEERTARARVADEGARTGDHPAMNMDAADLPQIKPAHTAPEPEIADLPGLPVKKGAAKGPTLELPDLPAVKPIQKPAAKPAAVEIPDLPAVKATTPRGMPQIADLPAVKPKAAEGRPSPARTLLGVPAPLPSVAKAPVQSRYAHRSDSEGERIRPSPSRTLLGVAPGVLPTLGAAPQAAPSVEGAKHAAPSVAAAPRPQTKPARFPEETPTDRHPVMLDAARAAFAEVMGGPASAPSADKPTVPFEVPPEGYGNDEERATTVPPDSSLAMQPANDTARVHAEEPEEVDEPTEIASSPALRALREGANDIPELPDLMQDAVAESSPQPPSMSVEPELMAAISEGFAGATFSHPPGAEPVVMPAKTKPMAVPMAQRVTDMVKNPRLRALLLQLLLTAVVAYAVVWVDRQNREHEERVAAISRAPVATPAPATAAKPVDAVDEAPVPAADTAAAIEQPKAAQPGLPDEAAAASPTPPAPAPQVAAPVAEAPKEPTVAPTPAPVEEDQEDEEDEDPAAAGGGSTRELVRSGLKLLAAGDAAGAEQELARAVAADGRNPHARAGLAEALLALGKPDLGLVQIEEAIRLRARRAHYRVVQGDILKALGKDRVAVAAWQKALEIDPNERDAKQRLGR